MKKQEEKKEPVLAGKSKAGMEDILRELKQKMQELEELKKQVQKSNANKISVQKTREMLEEIIVPPLEMIKEPKPKNVKQNAPA